jgi:hypothetical protein
LEEPAENGLIAASRRRSHRRYYQISDLIVANVRFWHKADIATRSTNVRFRG